MKMTKETATKLNELLGQLSTCKNGIRIAHNDENVILGEKLDKDGYAICGGDNEKVLLTPTINGKYFYKNGGYKADEPLKVETIQCERDYNEALRTSKTSKRLSIIAIFVSVISIVVSVFLFFFKQ